MSTSSDLCFTYDLGRYYAILPFTHDWRVEDYLKHFRAMKVPLGFTYNSGTNTEWLSVGELRELITEHVDNDFSYEANTIRKATHN